MVFDWFRNLTKDNSKTLTIEGTVIAIGYKGRWYPQVVIKTESGKLETLSLHELKDDPDYIDSVLLNKKVRVERKDYQNICFNNFTILNGDLTTTS